MWSNANRAGSFVLPIVVNMCWFTVGYSLDSGTRTSDKSCFFLLWFLLMLLKLGHLGEFVVLRLERLLLGLLTVRTP